MNGKPEVHIHALPDNALLRVFLLLPPACRRTPASVCKRWAAVSESKDAVALWEHVQVGLPAHFERSVSLWHLYDWFLARAAAVRRLDVDLGSREGWAPLHSLLGLVGRSLQHLRVYGDSESAFDAGSAAPWLALTPNLVSLELENAADWTIDKACFPPGLTHLELSYCGTEGLYCVPERLGLITNLQSLELQSSMFDGESTMENMRLCTSLRRLDLTNCCLQRVPAVLSNMAQLSSLTLNQNEGLGGDGKSPALAVLATLRSLKRLEMRECGLASMPTSLTGLTALRTLLLGYNDMRSESCIPPGPYLERLAMLAMSDSFQDDTSFGAAIVEPLSAAKALEVLRLNRNFGMALTEGGIAALVKDKPCFRKLEFSEGMAGELDLTDLRCRFPGVAFVAID